MHATWSTIAAYVSRYRGVLLGAILSAAAVAVTLDPSASLARSGLRFALWFALAATAIAVGLVGAVAISELRAGRARMPRAVVRPGIRRRD